MPVLMKNDTDNVMKETVTSEGFTKVLDFTSNIQVLNRVLSISLQSLTCM